MTRPVRAIVEVVPESLKRIVLALTVLSIVLGGAYLLATLRSRRLERQRAELLGEVGLLQGALLPPVPERLGALRASVAYRPADGPGAGGDFYDALTLPGNRAAFILGDVSGHGRDALARTAFLRYTLRAYLEAGLEPRVALAVAGRVIDDKLEGDFATVLLAVHDPETGSLTYASAGHPPPLIAGPERKDPILAGSAPPLGTGFRTGMRQTTVPLPAGSVACIFTDGLPEARREDGGILGRGRLGDILEELEEGASARDLLERVAAEAHSAPDDMAACLFSPTGEVTSGGFPREQLEVTGEDLSEGTARRFLEACGLCEHLTDRALEEALATVRSHGGAVLEVSLGNRHTVEVLPRNVESIEAASLRLAARVR